MPFSTKLAEPHITNAVADRQARRVSGPSVSHPDSRTREQLLSDLHDRLGPGLAGLEVRLQLLAEDAKLGATAPEQVASLRDEVSRLVGELRRIVHSEPPETLERLDLIGAVKEALNLLALAGLEVSFAASGSAANLSPAVTELLYRATLEGTANVVRHAQARHCWVLIQLRSARATLIVRDDGVGAVGVGGRLTGHRGGIGLASLRVSARRAGGRAHLLRNEAHGMTLIVTVPLPGAARRFLLTTTGRPVAT
ncbi:MAG TPA: histidine kinase [Trueperaceae bacterium]|nr:histidine kinase [Trueperaceae bacterium]